MLDLGCRLTPVGTASIGCCPLTIQHPAVYWTHAVSGRGFRIDGAGDLEPAERPHDRRGVCHLLPAVRRLLRGVHGGGRDHHHAAQLFENRKTQFEDHSSTWGMGGKGWAGRSLRFERGLPFTQWRPPLSGRLLDSEGSRDGASQGTAGTLLLSVSRLRRRTPLVHRPNEEAQSENGRIHRQWR